MTDEVQTSEQSADIPVPARLSKVESMLEMVIGFIDKVGPVLSAVVPTAAPVVGAVDAVGHVAETVIDDLTGKADPAALAAASISTSTGNVALDARLSQLETFAQAAHPILQYLARQFGLTEPVAPVAPVAVAVEQQGL